MLCPAKPGHAKEKPNRQLAHALGHGPCPVAMGHDKAGHGRGPCPKASAHGPFDCLVVVLRGLAQWGQHIIIQRVGGMCH